MGKAGGLALIGAIALLTTAWTPTASAGSDDCMSFYFTLTQDQGMRFEYCPGGGIGVGPDGLPAPGAPSVPPLPDGPGDPVGGILAFVDERLPYYQTRPCPTGFYGRETDLQQYTVFTCVQYDYRVPTLSSLQPSGGISPSPSQPGDGDAGTMSCPPGTFGKAVSHGATHVGACIKLEYRVPTYPFTGGIHFDGRSCTIGEHRGTDPALILFDGGVAFCVFPWIEIGPLGGIPDPGTIEIDDVPITIVTEPCSPRGSDPAVYLGDGFVYTCVEVGLTW